MIDWNNIISQLIWPATVLVIILIFRKRIATIVFSNSTFGELLIKLNNKEQLIKDPKIRKQINKLHSTDVWALQDLESNKVGTISKMNPAQKVAYMRLIKTPFIGKENDKLVLTQAGKEILRLVRSIEL